MLFNSLAFVVFFAIVLAIHNLPLKWKVKKIHLLVASYVFYAAWNPPFVILLWISTVVDWFAARAMSRAQQLGKRRLLLCFSLLANLGMLSYFKYGKLLTETFVQIINQVGIEYTAPTLDIILPVGISFYTFQTLSYTIDVYLKRSQPESSFLDFALFVTFFPQLVAGPIVRPHQLIPQFKTPRKATGQQFAWGLFLFSWGLFQKSVIADGILSIVTGDTFNAMRHVAVLDAWLGVLAFSAQIFFDFAGYSMCAIGIALCLGFSIPNNFKSPYAAVGFSDFWKRWHISLSEWLRDYLYIPLGGNRKGRRRTYINLMLTMLLGGLWHGASWRFLIWGGVHGLYLVTERLLKKVVDTEKLMARPLVPFLGAIATFFCVSLTWVFFAAKDWEKCQQMFESLFGLAEEPLLVVTSFHIFMTILILVAMLICHWKVRDIEIEDVADKTPSWLFTAFWVTILFVTIMTGGSASAFIYFQF
ncbi:MAG: membrane-bound O-acyltransferase family protein [Planctomycetaceae bacterium]|nr:membrane-bound O-acyltransferase family protein [Planctomycetaceae bacterium]